jgi:hypothetical protein
VRHENEEIFMLRLVGWIWRALTALGASTWPVIDHPIAAGPVDLADDDSVRAAFAAIIVREFGHRSLDEGPAAPAYPTDDTGFYFGWGRMF